MNSRSLFGFDALQDSTLDSLLERSLHWSTQSHRGPAASSLGASASAFVFLEPSSRTRISFERAAQRLGIAVSHFPVSESSLQKGESLLDTFLNLEVMGFDVFVVRTSHTQELTEIADQLKVPVLCAGSGREYHPTQALLDAATLMSENLLKDKTRILYWGDVENSRVAASGADLFRRLGAEVGSVGPTTHPNRLSQITQFRSPSEALRWAEIVIALRFQKERVGAHTERLDPAWTLNEGHLASHAQIKAWMHPGPVIWGEDVAFDLRRNSKNLVLKQAKMGVAVRMAALEWSLGVYT